MCDYVRVWDSTIGRAIRKGTPLPKRHGRLIDADAVEAELQWAIEAELTIIEADKETKYE